MWGFDSLVPSQHDTQRWAASGRPARFSEPAVWPLADGEEIAPPLKTHGRQLGGDLLAGAVAGNIDQNEGAFRFQPLRRVDGNTMDPVADLARVNVDPSDGAQTAPEQMGRPAAGDAPRPPDGEVVPPQT